MVDQAEIHRKIIGGGRIDCIKAMNELLSNYPVLPDQEQVWEDLHLLAQHEYDGVRLNVAWGLGIAFPHIPDKKQAWNDLHKLSHDEYNNVRWYAAGSLGAAFSYISNKEQAWEDLHRLSQDRHSTVQRYAAWGLGIAFPYISDKKLAWEDLNRLSQENDNDVRIYANYSMGRVSIFKATEAENEEELRKELEKSFEFFNKASKKATYFNPTQFCLPFYRSFYTIIFGKKDADTEVQKYLAEAKNAVEGADSKEKLLEAIENLANALKEVHKAREMGLKAIQSDFNNYRRYIERAAELLDTTADKAPGATKIIRKGLPIIDEKIKRIIAEIQKNAEELWNNTKNTPLEELGKEVNRIGTNLLQIRDPIGLEKNIDIFMDTLSAICARMPEEERGEACFQLQKAKDEQYIEDKFPLVNVILSKIQVLITQAKDNEKIVFV